ncbi:MAG: periplasmic heavy metal sensor [Vicinamibacteria bacterium]
MRPRFLVVVCALAAVVSLGVSWGVQAFRTSAAQAARDPFAELGLSAEQRHAVRETALRHHPRLVTMQALAEAKRAELAELLAGPQGGDAAGVEACLREISRLEAERDLEVVANLRELKPHLTHEQQVALFQYIQLRHTALVRGQ